mmetsp:Transcript_103593/g.195055  ORF Transcript_103593/g.195055 Transcript_103593/m.195055 type:complete len:96 (-) Transcript_103593:11-298(-)
MGQRGAGGSYIGTSFAISTGSKPRAPAPGCASGALASIRSVFVADALHHQVPGSFAHHWTCVCCGSPGRELKALVSVDRLSDISVRVDDSHIYIK